MVSRFKDALSPFGEAFLNVEVALSIFYISLPCFHPEIAVPRSHNILESRSSLSGGTLYGMVRFR